MTGNDRSLVEFPALSAPLRWRNISLTGFQVLDDLPPIEEVQSVNVVPFVGNACIVIGLADGSVSLPGGTMERGESFLETARRELREEVGAEIRSLALVGQWACHSHDPRPWRSHLPHPDFIRLVLCGEVEIVGPPENPTDGEQVARVEVLSLNAAVACLAAAQRHELAALYQVAHEIWTKALVPSPSIRRFDAHRLDR